ncbi:hypothetical protein K491DRAFT_692894 [Lophiostoma macrostomum CBS 122681]|uniref:Uncharacterized protein n=1 Tax=Lophiostoma macrostomum CBS 122681 TaxID=1314788 RepID=A0A6A6T5V0_9PLEO|nr:hypothetical protein K491DRAFT_692894 [Lophiostoma macrostomum CBS 122681]
MSRGLPVFRALHPSNHSAYSFTCLDSRLMITSHVNKVRRKFTVPTVCLHTEYQIANATSALERSKCAWNDRPNGGEGSDAIAHRWFPRYMIPLARPCYCYPQQLSQLCCHIPTRQSIFSKGPRSTLIRQHRKASTSRHYQESSPISPTFLKTVSMKLSMIFLGLCATVAIAAPPAISLKRSVKNVIDESGNIIQVRCVECPCDSWDIDSCRCVAHGCCC